MSAIRSMTGYARLRRPTPAGEITVSLRAVNHRGLDIRLYLSPDVEHCESAIRAAVARHVVRGHLDVRLRLEKTEAAAIRYNRALMQSYVDAFRAAAAEFQLPAEPDLNAAFRLPDMFGGREPDPDSSLDAPLAGAVEEAARLLNETREREGASIAVEVRTHNRRIRESAGAIETLREGILPLLQARLRQRLEEVLAGAAIDPQRLVQEAAILADRSDIAEELARLKIHCGRLDAMLDSGGEVGRKLEFLAQEMLREAGTLLAKTGSTGETGMPITELGLQTKSAIEKIREQALNLE